MNLSTEDQITVKRTYALLKSLPKAYGLKIALVAVETNIRTATEITVRAGQLVVPPMEMQIRTAICEQMLVDYDAFVAENLVLEGFQLGPEAL